MGYFEEENRPYFENSDKWNHIHQSGYDIIEDFAECMKRGDSPDSSAAQSAVQRLTSHLSDSGVGSSDEVLSELCDIYVSGDKLSSNIDSHGFGTARYMSDAISYYRRH